MMEKVLVGFGIMLLVVLMPLLIASITVEPPATPRDFSGDGVFSHSSGANSYYTVNDTLAFGYIRLNENFVQFNMTRFNVSGVDQVNVSLDYLAVNVSDVAEGDIALSYYVDTESGLVVFNISNDFVDDYLLLNSSSFIQGIYLTNSCLFFNVSNPNDCLYHLMRPYRYDIVLDTAIDASDLTSLLSCYLDEETTRQDINEDGVVNYLDRSAFQHHWGEAYN